MDRAASKVAEAIRVLLQHDDLDAGPRKHYAEHHAGRPPADDASVVVLNWLFVPDL
jgi:hypothetical protein